MPEQDADASEVHEAEELVCVAFITDDEFAAGRGSPGIGRLFIDGSQVGESEIPVTVPLAFALSGEGLCAGWDSLTPATNAYDDEFRFSGTLRQVVVELVD